MIDFAQTVWELVSFNEYIALFWLLPSLIMFLILDPIVRFLEDSTELRHKPMSEWGEFEWKFIIICSVFYPLGLLATTLIITAVLWTYFHTMFVHGRESQWKNIFFNDIKSIKLEKTK